MANGQSHSDQVSAIIHPNPTVFTVCDAPDVMWLVDTYAGHDKQQMLQLIKHVIAKRGCVFASYYRPGEFWDEEVFVCPRCQHATRIDFAVSDKKSHWYCKYCYTSWACSEDRGVFQMADDYVEVHVDDCKRTTDKAALLVINDEEHWVPFSQIEDNDEPLREGYCGSLYLTAWICEQKGIELE